MSCWKSQTSLLLWNRWTFYIHIYLLTKNKTHTTETLTKPTRFLETTECSDFFSHFCAFTDGWLLVLNILSFEDQVGWKMSYSLRNTILDRVMHNYHFGTDMMLFLLWLWCRRGNKVYVELSACLLNIRKKQNPPGYQQIVYRQIVSCSINTYSTV